MKIKIEFDTEENPCLLELDRVLEDISYLKTIVESKKSTLKKESNKIQKELDLLDEQLKNKTNIISILDLVEELEKEMGKTVLVEHLIDKAKIKKISEDEVYKVVEILKRTGEIFEPKKDCIQRI